MERLLLALVPSGLLTGLFVGLVAIGTRGAGEVFSLTAYLSSDWQFVGGLFVVTFALAWVTFED